MLCKPTSYAFLTPLPTLEKSTFNIPFRNNVSRCEHVRADSTDRLPLLSNRSISMIAEVVESGGKHLSSEALERARKGNKFEKVKLKKDGSVMWTEIRELSALLREGKTSWEDIDVDDIDTRLKWAGLFHRRKRTPGRFMMRLKVPNGILNSSQIRYFAKVLTPYADDGCADITTRMNIQLRGMPLDDAADICAGLYEHGLTSFMSGMDNVRNMVGSPIAGIDPDELIDTRPLCTALNDMITNNRQGRSDLANLPRKFNICVSGSRDDFAHTHINDIGLVPVPHDETGEIGFNVIMGGFFSVKRNAEAIPIDVWLPTENVVGFCEAVLTWFRDNGDRGNRQATRIMYMMDKLTIPGFRDAIESHYGKKLQRAQTGGPEYEKAVGRRNVLGVHSQKQYGFSWVCACVPAGRLSASDLVALADLADKYSDGELRITVEQNVLFPNVADDKVSELLAEDLLQKFQVKPGAITANMVSCTGAQFCGIALIETKNRAIEIAKRLDETVEVPRDVRIHWTGCPNSCGQAQVGDIGLMGTAARKDGKAVEGVRIFVGGRIGEDATLADEIGGKPVPADADELLPVLQKLLVEKYNAKMK